MSSQKKIVYLLNSHLFLQFVKINFIGKLMQVNVFHTHTHTLDQGDCVSVYLLETRKIDYCI